MNLYHLKYFYDSARLRSVTKAATINSVGQPAISKGIQALEILLKSELLSHRRNRFELTDEGEVVFSYCEKIFSATDELKDALTQTSTPSGSVRFASPSSMAEGPFLADSIKKCLLLAPSLNLQLQLGRTDLVRDWVLDNSVDLGIVLDNIDTSEFESTPLHSGKFYLIKARGFKGDWQSSGIIRIEDTREIFDLRKRYKALYGKEIQTQLQINSWGVIKNFVLAKMGVGFVPD